MSRKTFYYLCFSNYRKSAKVRQFIGERHSQKGSNCSCQSCLQSLNYKINNRIKEQLQDSTVKTLDFYIHETHFSNEKSFCNQENNLIQLLCTAYDGVALQLFWVLCSFRGSNKEWQSLLPTLSGGAVSQSDKDPNLFSHHAGVSCR